jgi:acetyltransferase-like isoleucine patch superfamily enzyme
MWIKIIALVRAVILFLFSSKVASIFFKEISNKSNIWLSLVYYEKGVIENCHIGPFNLLICNKLKLSNYAKLGRLNKIVVNGELLLNNKASIGNRNVFTSAMSPKVYIDRGSLEMGPNSIITSDHFFDLMGHIFIGSESVIAGKGSQFWTHSYNHHPFRHRVDGDIHIGSDVYLGSRVIMLPDSRIGDGCAVGAGAVISGSLEDEIVAVSAKLRQFGRKNTYAARVEVTKSKTCERVFRRQGTPYS